MRNFVLYFESPLITITFPDLKWIYHYCKFLVTIQEFSHVYNAYFKLLKVSTYTLPSEIKWIRELTLTDLSTNPFVFKLFNVLNI